MIAKIASEASVKKILALVAARYQVKAPELRSANQTPRIVEYRSIAMYVIRMSTNRSFPDIGRLFNKDHTTVMDAVKRVERDCTHDENAQKTINGFLSEARVLLAEEERALVQTHGAMLPAGELPVDTSPTGKEPPLITLLKTTRDELARVARDTHRLSMLVENAIVRLEHRETHPITVNTQRADEEVK